MDSYRIRARGSKPYRALLCPAARFAKTVATVGAICLAVLLDFLGALGIAEREGRLGRGASCRLGRERGFGIHRHADLVRAQPWRSRRPAADCGPAVIVVQPFG